MGRQCQPPRTSAALSSRGTLATRVGRFRVRVSGSCSERDWLPSASISFMRHKLQGACVDWSHRAEQPFPSPLSLIPRAYSMAQVSHLSTRERCAHQQLSRFIPERPPPHSLAHGSYLLPGTSWHSPRAAVITSQCWSSTASSDTQRIRNPAFALRSLGAHCRQRAEMHYVVPRLLGTGPLFVFFCLWNELFDKLVFIYSPEALTPVPTCSFW